MILLVCPLDIPCDSQLGRTPKGPYSQGGVQGTFWINPPLRSPSENPSRNHFLLENSQEAPILRTLLRTLPQNPSQNLLRTLLRTLRMLCCRTTPWACTLPISARCSSFGFGKRGLLEKGSFQKSPFSREPPDCGKERRIRPFSRYSREFRDFRDSRDSSSEKTPFAMTRVSVPDSCIGCQMGVKTSELACRTWHELGSILVTIIWTNMIHPCG